MQRTVDPASRQIDEIVVQPGRKPGEKPSEFITHLTRRGSSTVFDAVDEGHTFRGTLAFKGADWAWDAWTYQITLSDGGKLVGDGSLTSGGIVTRKRVLGKNGEPTVSVTETLSPITQQKYDALRTALLGR